MLQCHNGILKTAKTINNNNNNNNKGHTRTDREGSERKLRYRSTRSLISAQDGLGDQTHAPTALPLGKRPDTRCTGA